MYFYHVYFLVFISAWYLDVWANIQQFYSTDPKLTIFVSVFTIVGIFLLLGFVVLNIYKCKNDIQSYNVKKFEKRNGKKHNQDSWRSMDCEGESGEYMEMQPVPPTTRPRRQTGPKVMIVDETGNIPPYRLKTRSRDGSIQSMTYYNPELGCMETML
jgi:hypothetical protein